MGAFVGVNNQLLERHDDWVFGLVDDARGNLDGRRFGGLQKPVVVCVGRGLCKRHFAEVVVSIDQKQWVVAVFCGVLFASSLSMCEHVCSTLWT